MQLNAGMKLLMAVCTILGCLGQIFVSSQEAKEASDELKEAKANKAKNETSDSEAKEV